MATRHDELREQVLAFHRAHPEVWDLFCRFTRDRIARGFKHFSADAVFHRIRWEASKPEYNKGEEFKLNNNHAAFYARAFMTKYPEHAGFFRLREQKSRATRASNLPQLSPAHFDTAA